MEGQVIIFAAHNEKVTTNFISLSEIIFLMVCKKID